MKHLKENNETYINHLTFAAKVGLNLVYTGIIFLLHAIFPICAIPRSLNLENTSKKIQKWNEAALKRNNK